MHTMWQDFRYAFRTLRKNPGLNIVIVLSLAIGIGANSAIFSVVDALLLRPLPYPHQERLANIWLRSPGIGILRDWPSPGQFIDLRNENHSFEEMAIARLTTMNLTGRERPERVEIIRASSALLTMLGAKPMLGRLLLPEEDKPGKAPVAVLTYAAWRRLFNSDRLVLGKNIILNGKPFTVAGILGPDFRISTEAMPAEGPMQGADVFLPLPLGPEAAQSRGDENYNVLARLKPGVSFQQAQSDVDAVAGRIRVKDKRDRSFGMAVVGLQEQVVGDVRRALLVLLGSVAFVLLIACANVANLLLSRAAGRGKEVAIRTALGAGIVRLLRQLMIESLLLALLSGAAGLVIAFCTLSVVRTLNPGNIPRLEEIRINGAVLAFTFGLSVLVGILFGLAPAWRAIRLDLNSALKSGGRSGQTDASLRLSRNRLRGLLVVSELALSLMLLTGAGLLIRSFVRLQGVRPGFAADDVISMQVSISGPKYKEHKAVVQFYQELEQRLLHLAGLQSAGFVSALPLTGTVGWGQINVEGYKPPPGQELQVDIRLASADYFRAMGIPLLKGRFFDPHDTADSRLVVMIDENFAKRFWPAGDAVGKHLWFDHPEKPYTITGVAGVVKQYSLDNDGKIAVYFAETQEPSTAMYIVARASSNAPALAGPMMREIHVLDPDAVVYDIRTMQGRLEQSLARQRFSTMMLGSFAAFALLLAAIGIYGVMSYLVSQGTHDIGVRIALGARAGDVASLIVRQGMELAVIGILGGLVGALVLTRVMASLLYGVSATDVLTFSAVAAILATVAFVASLIPARRATAVDPMIALREE